MRSHDAQRAFGFIVYPTQIRVEGLPVRKDLLGALEAALAVLGELHRVGGAAQEPKAQEALENLEPAAHGGLRRAHLRRSRRQTSRLDDMDEGLQQLNAIGVAGHVGQRSCRPHGLELYAYSVYPFCAPRYYRHVGKDIRLRFLFSFPG